MRANSSSAVMVSLTLHGVVAALIFLTTVYVAHQQKTPPVIFELVAGPPTAPEQPDAPALGIPDWKLTVPKVAVPEEKPQPVPEAVRPTPRTKPAETKPKPETSIAKEMKKKERMSYKEYRRAHPDPKPAPPAPVRAPRIDTEGIAAGVLGGSPANKKGGGGGKALTRAERSELDTYISFLISALKEAHQPPPGLSDQLVVKVTFDIAANGRISNPRVERSSGNREFDESALEAFRNVASIGPTP
ncbi:MAG: TonB family protein, partial [Opitutae bacterium]|nr:TonB family protein [Opitutae bacterium]